MDQQANGSHAKPAGTMQQIREYLEQGMTSGEVIAKGYAPGTTYKVQREFRDQLKDVSLVPIETLEPGNLDALPPESSVVSELNQRVTQLLEEQAQIDSLRVELEQARSRIEELEGKVGQAENLENQIVSMRQEAATWQHKFIDSQKSLKQSNQELVRAQQAVRGLKPLAVWYGHPCMVCGDPTDGIVNRATAARLLSRAGHGYCLENAGLKQITFHRPSVDQPLGPMAVADDPRTKPGILITR